MTVNALQFSMPLAAKIVKVGKGPDLTDEVTIGKVEMLHGDLSASQTYVI